MLEEGAVLGGEERLYHLARIFLIFEHHAPLAGEGLHDLAVDAADMARERRLVGQQLVGRREPAREEQPEVDIRKERHGDADRGGLRSEGRRVGKECVSTCSSRWSTTH